MVDISTVKRPSLITTLMTALAAASCSPTSTPQSTIFAATSAVLVILSLTLVGCSALVSYNGATLKIRIPLQPSTDSVDSNADAPTRDKTP